MSIDKWYQSNGHIRVIRYVLIVVAVTLLMAFGVAFSIKSGLGTSPISSVPYVLSLITPFSVGGVTILLNCFLIALQPLILGRLFKKSSLIQLPAAFFFGYATDFALFLLKDVQATTYFFSCVFCLIGVALLSSAVAIEGYSEIVILSGEGLSLAISRRLGLNYGNVKITVDVTLVLLALCISIISLHRAAGIREGTLFSALLVGFTAKKIIKLFDFISEKRRRYE